MKSVTGTLCRAARARERKKAKGLGRNEYGFAFKKSSPGTWRMLRSYFDVQDCSFITCIISGSLSWQTGQQRQRKQLPRNTHLTLSCILCNYSNPLSLSNVDASSRNTIANSTVVCLVTKPLSGSEAGVEFLLIGTSVLFLCKGERGSIHI